MKKSHWIAIATLLLSLQAQLLGINAWSEGVTPVFVAGLIGNLAAFIIALASQKPRGEGLGIVQGIRKRMSDDQNRTPLIAFAIGLSALVAGGCAMKGAVKPVPTTTEVQRVRQLAVRVSDHTKDGLAIAQSVGGFINELPIDVKAKDDYSCAVIRVTGTSAPRPQLLQTCGPATPQGPGPLHKALESLKNVSTEPGLKATVDEILRNVRPLITKLEASQQSALRAFGLSLRTVFALLEGLLQGSVEQLEAASRWFDTLALLVERSDRRN